MVNPKLEYSLDEIHMMKYKLKRLSINMGSDESWIRSKMYKIQVHYVLKKINQHDGFGNVKRENQIDFRVIKDLANPPEWPPVEGFTEYESISKVYDKLKQEIVKGKIRQWDSFSELNSLKSDLENGIIDYYDELKKQTKIIKARLDKDYQKENQLLLSQSDISSNYNISSSYSQSNTNTDKKLSQKYDDLSRLIESSISKKGAVIDSAEIDFEKFY